MSDALDKVSRVTNIPVFPLPLVLFPHEVMPLHIFEPRYRQMLTDVRAGNGIFGVSLFEPEDENALRPPAGTIGCTAEVRDVTPMADGRSNIVTSGLLRYETLEYTDRDTPYFTADVRYFEDEPEPPDALQSTADEVFEIFERIANAAFVLGGSRGRVPEIEKSEPEPMSFLIAAAFNFDNEMKYRLLKMTSTSERLFLLRSLLGKAVEQLEANAEITKRSQTNGHSSTKLDL